MPAQDLYPEHFFHASLFEQILSPFYCNFNYFVSIKRFHNPTGLVPQDSGCYLFIVFRFERLKVSIFYCSPFKQAAHSVKNFAFFLFEKRANRKNLNKKQQECFLLARFLKMQSSPLNSLPERREQWKALEKQLERRKGIANSVASFSMAKMAGEINGAKNLNAKKRGGAISTENSY